jgi:hypothetical protein
MLTTGLPDVTVELPPAVEMPAAPVPAAPTVYVKLCPKNTATARVEYPPPPPPVPGVPAPVPPPPPPHIVMTQLRAPIGTVSVAAVPESCVRVTGVKPVDVDDESMIPLM